jgi:alkanesulfonate monooxygenase SsuD/methylene tetrahydromethanopterin reductase-like flavin-dependent oxidoreductase (luciferase family)
VHLEGEGDAQLALAARSADGWITTVSRPEQLAPRLSQLRELRARAETLDGRFSVSVYAPGTGAALLGELEALGVARVLVGTESLA